MIDKLKGDKTKDIHHEVFMAKLSCTPKKEQIPLIREYLRKLSKNAGGSRYVPVVNKTESFIMMPTQIEIPKVELQPQFQRSKT